MSHTIIKLKSNNTFVLNDQKVESLYIDSKNETINIMMESGAEYRLSVNTTSTSWTISSETYHDLVDYWIGD
jgi:hypothetical protein